MLDREEDRGVRERYQEAVDALLEKGIPIYYSETGGAEGRIIKKHPCGKLEYVSFDWETRKERVIGPVETSGH